MARPDKLRSSRRTFLKVTAGAGVIGAAGCIGDDDGEYPTQDPTIIQAFGEGGAFDAYGRAIAEAWEEQLETDQEFQFDFQEGAGGIIAAESTWNADPDGYTLSIFNVPSLIISELAEEVEYDSQEFTWLGRFDQPPWLWATRAGEGPNNWDEFLAMDETVVAGSTSAGSLLHAMALIFEDEFDVDFEVVPGYDPIGEGITAMLAEETDIAFGTPSHLMEYIEEGDVEVMMAFTGEEDPLWEGATLTDEVDELDWVSDTFNVSRILGAPPGIDDDLNDLLVETLEAALQDEDLIEWGEETGHPINNVVVGDDLDDVIADTVDTWEQHQDLLDFE